MAEPIEEYLSKLTAMANLSGDYRSVLNSIQSTERSLPNHHMINVIKGMCFHGLQEDERAAEEYEKAIKLNPNSAWAYFRKGELHRDLGEYGQALDCFRKATEYKPHRPDFWVERGFVEEELDDVPSALKSYEESINHGSDRGWGWYGKARCLIYAQRFEEAQDALKNALDLNPDEQEFKELRGKILEFIRL